MSGTAGAWLAEASARLRAAGVERPRAEARALLAHALDLSPERLFAYPETPVDAARADAAAAVLVRRLEGEPLSRIRGTREFWSLEFRISPATLDPRADSEILVETALELTRGRQAPVALDLGTGSGCLLLAYLHDRPDAFGLGLDAVEAAVRTARENAGRLGLGARARFAVGDWAGALAEAAFDLALVNPPYVATEAGPAPDAATLAHDPPRALWAGPDGLDAYRALLAGLLRALRPGGVAALEGGAGQAAAISGLAAAEGFAVQGVRRDLGGVERCIVIKKP